MHTLNFRAIKVSTFVYIISIIIIYFMPMRIIGITLKNDLVLVITVSTFIFGFIFFHFSFRSYAIKYLLYGLSFSCVFLFILILNQDYIVIKDIIECFKPLYFTLIFVCGKKASEIYKIEDVCRFIVILLLIGVFFSLLTYFKFSYPLLDLYKGRTSAESNLYHFFRFSGFLGYPSMFGIYLILGMIVTVSFDVSKYKNTIFLVLFLGFVLTMSKTGFVLFGLLMGYFLFLKASIKIILYSAVSFAVVLFVIITYLYNEFIIVFNAFSSVDGLLSSTFSHRFREITQAYQILCSENFDGFGPSNSYLKLNHGPVENVIFFYVYKFGYFGLVYYFSMVFFVAYKFLYEKNSSMKMVLFWCLLTLLIGSLAESITEEYKTLYFFPLLLGYFSGFRYKVHPLL